MNESLHLMNTREEKIISSEEITKPVNEVIEFVPKFNHIQEDLLYLFNINATSQSSLHYPFVKDEMYSKAIEELQLGTPFALDYMFEEKLLTKEDLQSRHIEAMKPYAKTILATYKRGPRLTRAKDLFVDSGLLTRAEANSYSDRPLANDI